MAAPPSKECDNVVISSGLQGNTLEEANGNHKKSISISLPTESCSDIAVLITLYVAQRKNSEREKTVECANNL